jgi:hypothetical protein
MKNDIKVWRNIFKKWMKKKRLWSEYLRENENRDIDYACLCFKEMRYKEEFIINAFQWNDSKRSDFFWNNLYIDWKYYTQDIKIVPDTRIGRNIYTIIAEDSGYLLVESHV